MRFLEGGAGVVGALAGRPFGVFGLGVGPAGVGGVPVWAAAFDAFEVRVRVASDLFLCVEHLLVGGSIFFALLLVAEVFGRHFGRVVLSAGGAGAGTGGGREVEGRCSVGNGIKGKCLIWVEAAAQMLDIRYSGYGVARDSVLYGVD